MNHDHENVLFVGMGGGNDIFSTILAIASLKKDGWRWKKCAIAGPIGPFFRYDGMVPTGINGVFRLTENATRYLWRKDSPKDIGLVNSAVAKMLKKTNPYNVADHFALSLEGGSEGLIDAFRVLNEEGYDYFVLIDVGGDVFYSGKRDYHVLTPMSDALVLKGFQDAGLEGTVFLAGPNTDGETEIESLAANMLCARPEVRGLDFEVVDEWYFLYEKYIESSRKGNTVPRTHKALYSHERIITFDHKSEERIGNLRFYVEFPQRVDTTLCRRFYLFIPNNIHNPFAVSCGSVQEWFTKTQALQQHTHNEANTQYLKVDSEVRQFLTPSPLLKTDERFLLIEQGLADLRRGITDRAWLLASDAKYFGNELSKKELLFSEDQGLVSVRKAQ